MSSPERRFYDFGPFRVDVANRRLLRESEFVPLKAKAFDTLLWLVERAGDVLEKDELMRGLWPDSFVEESNLTQNIYMLRKALGEGYIETIPRRGYRFSAPVTAPDARPADLVVIHEQTQTSVSYVEKTDEAPPLRTRSRRGVLWLTVAGAGCVALIAALVVASRGQAKPFDQAKLERITTTGTATRAAISSDGRYIAYVSSVAGSQSLWLRQIATSKDLQIVPPQQTDFYGVTFAHDGSYIYYVSQEINRLGMLFQVPTLGGAPRKLVEDVDSPPAVSPDDTQLAFTRLSPTQRSIVIVRSDGTGEHALVSQPQTDGLRIAPGLLAGPAWSPDGTTIATAVGITPVDDGAYQTVWGFPVTGGEGRRLTPQRWPALGALQWLPNGRFFIALATDDMTSVAQQVWVVPVERSGARKVTNDIGDYRDVSLTADGRTMLLVQSDRTANVWVTASSDMEAARQVTFTGYDGLDGLAWTPDGKLVYTVRTNDGQNLWLADLSAGTSSELTSRSGYDRQPVIARSGRAIVFTSNRTGQYHLWAVDLDGTHARQLTDGTVEFDPAVTPDGEHVFFRRSEAGRASIYRMPFAGGTPRLFAPTVAGEPVVSPDGTRVLFFYRPTAAGMTQIAIAPVSGGAPKRIGDFPAHYGRFRWSPDGKAIAYTSRGRGVGNIWVQALDGSTPAPITAWGSDPVFSFEWSPDGKWLAYARGSLSSDVIAMTDVAR